MASPGKIDARCVFAVSFDGKNAETRPEGADEAKLPFNDLFIIIS